MDSGFLYKPGNYGDAASYVRTLVGDDILRSQMGREARLEVWHLLHLYPFSCCLGCLDMGSQRTRVSCALSLAVVSRQSQPGKSCVLKSRFMQAPEYSRQSCNPN